MNDPAARWTEALSVELSGLTAPQQARWSVRDQLAGTVSSTFLRDLLLATSEVVTNAVRYAPGPCRLTLTRDPGSHRIRVTVADVSREIPPPLDQRDDASDTGRGLLVVDTVATAWGIRPLATGKEIWFEMEPDQRS